MMRGNECCLKTTEEREFDAEVQKYPSSVSMHALVLVLDEMALNEPCRVIYVLFVALNFPHF